MPRWMINCEEHSRLASQDLDRPLLFWDRFSVRVHRWICPPCRQYKKQLNAIRSACRDRGGDINEDRGKGPVLSEDACRRMKSAIREHLKR
jgi:hypothetical protein